MYIRGHTALLLNVFSSVAWMERSAIRGEKSTAYSPQIHANKREYFAWRVLQYLR